MHHLDGRNIAQNAKLWLGTPYVEYCKILGIGCDCLGLICGVLQIEEDLRNLGFDKAIEKYFTPIQSAQIGDILHFNFKDQSHFAILIEDNFLIHAHWSRGVIKNSFGAWFVNKQKGAYRFKG
jgi:cell wall-associated NlpC family hydrolase